VSWRPEFTLFLCGGLYHNFPRVYTFYTDLSVVHICIQHSKYLKDFWPMVKHLLLKRLNNFLEKKKNSQFNYLVFPYEPILLNISLVSNMYKLLIVLFISLNPSCLFRHSPGIHHDKPVQDHNRTQAYQGQALQDGSVAWSRLLSPLQCPAHWAKHYKTSSLPCFSSTGTR
jgi:hypothetical protein